MLPEAQRDQLSVVLVRPRNPLNIGAVARAMANFGFERLSVVAPFAPHWREARSAVGAPDLLQTAKETESLAEAVADCTLVVGTGTLTHRKPEQRVAALPDLARLIASELARGGRAALVFGPEKHGLTREDLSYCNLLAEIPTDPRQPSMNLGQAAAVCLYELAMRAFAPPTPPATPPAKAGADLNPLINPAESAGPLPAAEKLHAERGGGFNLRIKPAESAWPLQAPEKPHTEGGGGFNPRIRPTESTWALAPEEMQPRKNNPADGPKTPAAPRAPSGSLDLLAGLVEQTMQAAGYSPRSMQAANRHDLRLLLRRLTLTQHDLRRILGLFRRILWRLNRNRQQQTPSK